MKKFFSRKSLLPDRTNHYDESGHKVGYSYDSELFDPGMEDTRVRHDVILSRNSNTVRLPGTQNETHPAAHYF